MCICVCIAKVIVLGTIITKRKVINQQVVKFDKKYYMFQTKTNIHVRRNPRAN